MRLSVRLHVLVLFLVQNALCSTRTDSLSQRIAWIGKPIIIIYYLRILPFLTSLKCYPSPRPIPPRGLRRERHVSLAWAPVGEWGEETDDISDYFLTCANCTGFYCSVTRGSVRKIGSNIASVWTGVYAIYHWSSPNDGRKSPKNCLQSRQEVSTESFLSLLFSRLTRTKLYLKLKVLIPGLFRTGRQIISEPQISFSLLSVIRYKMC